MSAEPEVLADADGAEEGCADESGFCVDIFAVFVIWSMIQAVEKWRR